MITLNHDMIVTFQTNGSSVPDIDKHLDKHFYYEDILNHLNKQQTDPTIHHLSIEYIDRGVRNWHVFWIKVLTLCRVEFALFQNIKWHNIQCARMCCL